MPVSLNEARNVMNGPKNYFGPGIDEFLKKNKNVQPEDVDEETKQNLWKNRGSNNFFGPEEWVQFLGPTHSIGKVPEIPWGKELLENPLIKQVHFLFLGLDSVGGNPLNMFTWNEILKAWKTPNIYPGVTTHNPELELNHEVCGARWYLMPVDGFGTYGQSFEKQLSKLPNGYEVPNVVERVTANILYFLVNGIYMDSDFSRTRNILYPAWDHQRAFVSSLTPEGIIIDGVEDGMWASIATSRKLPEGG